MMTTMLDCGAHLELFRKRFEQVLGRFLPPIEGDPTGLHAAMRYAVTNGGKRLRPTLVYAIGEFLDIPLEALDACACSVEFIHAYSLIHDDLPAMDNSDLRRGKPACHIAFDEATAILAGDCLQTLAFEILITQKNPLLNAQQRLAMVEILARVSGYAGMGGGQALDLHYTGKKPNQAQLESMYLLKTGALIQASIELPALIGKLNSEQQAALAAYGKWLGLAFQIHDDVLDNEADTETLGKPAQLDAQNDKCTFPGLLGIDTAKTLATQYCQKAINALDNCYTEIGLLRDLANYVTQRER